MSEEELQALNVLIRERQRCMADDKAALKVAQSEVMRFERAIELDERYIDEARRRISDYWTAKFEPRTEAVS